MAVRHQGVKMRRRNALGLSGMAFFGTLTGVMLLVSACQPPAPPPVPGQPLTYQQQFELNNQQAWQNHDHARATNCRIRYC
jgi:hypothetical protein